MPIYLKYNTASQEIPLGYFVDSTDGNTEETALTIANTDIKLWKTGATTLANKNSGGATHISNGIYYAVLDATDTNTIGPMVVFCHVSGALATRTECVVLPAQVYDSIIAGTDLLDVNTSQLGGTAQTGNDVGADVDAILADTGTDGVVVAAGSKTGYSLTATTGLGNQTANITGNLSGSVGSVTGAVGSVTGAVGSVTGNVGGNVTGSVGSISGVTFPTNFGDLSITVTTGLVDITQTAADKAWSTATRVLTANTNLNDPTAAAIADAVWDEAIAGHLGAGSTGAALNAAGAAGDPWSTSIPGAYGAGTAGYILGNNIDAAISTRSTVTTAQVNSECDTAISDAALATAANLATVDTVVDAIKAKTDSLTFTKAGEVDANVQSVNGVTITGDGSATPFGV